MKNYFNANNGGQKGIVKIIIILVIALLVLSYYGFDLRKTVESPTTHSNFSYVTEFVSGVWNTFLKTPVMYVWNEIFLKYIWATALDVMQHGSKGIMSGSAGGPSAQNGAGGDLINMAPQLPMPSAN
ncbi:MAG: hypothetical protein RIT04_371 [Candidatus Parcubacteria bacterium]|jgi:hypothetical protein